MIVVNFKGNAVAFAAILIFAAISMALWPAALAAAEADAAPFLPEAAGAGQTANVDARVVAVLFSISQTENSLKQFRDVPNLDLLDVNGAPMIKYVYDALHASKYVDKIIVVAAPEVEKALGLKEDAKASFQVDKGDAAENIKFGVDQVGGSDLVMFVPSDLALVTTEGIDRLIERVMAEKHVDIFFPLVSREVCEQKYPEEERTYARFEEGQFTGAHIEFLRPSIFFDNADAVESQKDKLYDVYYMRQNTLGIVRFLGLKLTLKYIFGSLSPEDVEEHVLDKYSVTAKTFYWDDADLSTDLSEPKDIPMVLRALKQREQSASQTRKQ
jgi:hypothetical protein